MTWYGQFLAGLAPDYQIRRLRAMQLTRLQYDAARRTRTHRGKKESRGPNAAVGLDGRLLREQVRALEQNSDVVCGALDVLVANTVGTGIRPEPMVKDKRGLLMEDVNARLLSLYFDWVRRPEVTWTLDEFSAQRLMVRSLYRDGEVLRRDIIGATRRVDHGTKVPYSYELIEADLLDELMDDPSRNIIKGVELNEWGRPIAYHMLQQHPNDVQQANRERARIDARELQHMKLTRRIRQARGVTAFHAVIKRVEDIDYIDESERVAARVAAAMAGFIKKGEPFMYQAPDPDDDAREIDLQPGMIFDDLRPGEDVAAIQSTRPNNSLIPYLQFQLRRFSSGAGTSYSSTAKDYSGTYSSQRQELVEQRLIYAIGWNYIVETSERPKWEHFVEAARLSGLVSFPAEVDGDTITDVGFAQVGMPWIDPLKEAAAFRELIDAELESRSHIIRSRGRDPSEVRRQIEQEGGRTAREPASSNEPNRNEDDDNDDANGNDDEGAREDGMVRNSTGRGAIRRMVVR